MTALRTAVALVVGLLAKRQYDTLERMTTGRLAAVEIERAVAEYGRTIVPLPPEAFEDMEVYPVAGSDPPTFSVDIGLWTQEEGRSDLTLSLELVDRDSGAYDITIDDLHVL